MIQPQVAPVRPRVQLADDVGAILLEDQVAMRLEEKQWGIVALIGNAGAGKSTAIAHLAKVFEGDSRVVLTDWPESTKPDGSCVWAPGQLVVCTASRLLAVRGLECWQLAPWQQDEWIEYLLSVHPHQCASVMLRVQADNNRNWLLGVPELWSVVLDRLAADETVSSVKTALRNALHARLLSAPARNGMRECCFTLLCDPSRSLKIAREQLRERYGVTSETCALQRHAAVQMLLGAEFVRDGLISNRNVQFLTRQFSAMLIREIADLIRDEPGILAWLDQLLLKADQRLHATAASLIHASGIAWTPQPTPAPNLSQAILTGIHWPGIRMTQLHIVKADLRGANLSESQFDRVDARYARLSAICLHGAQLQRFNASHADLSRADLSFVRASHGNFGKAVLRDANLEGSLLCESSFIRADVTGARFCRGDLSGTNFTAAEIERADFTGANLTAATLTGLTLRDATLDGAQFPTASLQECDMEWMQLPGANFEHAKLTGAHLTGSQMPHARFRGANLKSTGLAEIEWEGADLRDADLRGSSFHMGSTRSGLLDSPIACEGSRTGFYTDELNEQDFKAPEEIRKANLRNANLCGANIDGVDFYLVDLRGAEYTPEQEVQFRKCGAILEARV